MSCADSADFEIFRKLGNPECVDVPQETRHRKLATEMRAAVEKALATQVAEAAPAPPLPPPPPPPPPPASAVEEVPSSGLEDGEQQPARNSAFVEAVLRASAPLPELPPAPPAPSSPITPSPPQALPEPLPTTAASTSRLQEDDEEEVRRRTPEAERLEKQGFLIELQNLESRGARLSRRFTMRDGVAELEFEVNKQSGLLNTQSTVAFMRDSLRLLVHGVELANNRLGPFVSIEGWADSIVSDMGRFNAPLEKIYKQYFRKQQVSPLVELGWIIVGSLVMTHFKNKVFGAPRRDDAAAPPSKSFASASRVAPTAAPTPSARRPVLRSPTSLFGL